MGPANIMQTLLSARLMAGSHLQYTTTIETDSRNKRTMLGAGATDSAITRIVIKGLEYKGTKRGVLDRRYFIRLTVDDQNKDTSVSARTNTPAWGNIFHFDVHDSSKVIIKVFASRTAQDNKQVGWMEERVDTLLSKQVISCELDRGFSKKPAPIIAFTILKSTDPLPGHEIRQAKESIAQLNELPGQALLKNMDRFVNLVAGISEVNPIVKAAWSTLVIASKVLQDQIYRDEKIKQLLHSLDDLVAFLSDAEALKHFQLAPISKLQITVLEQVSVQITECAYFLTEYAKAVESGLCTIRHIFSNVDNQIKEYQDKFREFKSAFQEYGILGTQLTVLQTRFIIQQSADGVKNIASEVDLNGMLYATGASCIPEKGCLQGTREGIINEIVDWVNQPTDDTSPRLFWLSGVAGSGKSAIAHSIAHRFKALRRLGSSFCFDASNQASRGPMYLFSTISRDLAGFDALWKQVLWNIIQDDQSMRTTHSVQYQFENLLVKPAQHLGIVGPIVIVIDALDECGNLASRKKLLDIFSTDLSQLPGNFRILMTSRPEQDIVDTLQNRPFIYHKDMSSIEGSHIGNDIFLFIQNELDSRTKAHLTAREPNWCDILVQKSEGLFQWASTACLFMKNPGMLPYEQFQILCQSSETGRQLDNLDNLYHKVLGQVFPNPGPVTLKRFQAVIGVLLAVKTPVSRATLQFLCFEETAEGVVIILEPLGALLSGVSSDSIPIHTLHTSLRDFFLDESHSGVFHINANKAHWGLAMMCFQIMKAGLQFNICKLETSCRFNNDVSDLGTRIQKHISKHLQYACVYWADHLQPLTMNAMLKANCIEFMERHFLYWLEVLSLIEKLDSAVGTMIIMAGQMIDNDRNIAEMAGEGQSFVANFGSAIKRSTPHIYVSALPFAAGNSLLVNHYIEKFENILQVTRGKKDNWSLLRNVLEGHRNSVTAIGYSPDGKHIVSGSSDNTIRVWNALTSHAVNGPLLGHTEKITDVTYSPDGRWIASSSEDKTIRVWDATIGKSVGEPFNGHTGKVTAVAYSPNGKWIASGSEDNTIRVWDAATGYPVHKPFNGHTGGVTAVAYSPDGRYIVSGSWDATIRIWDAVTGHFLGEPMNGHVYSVMAVVYSPDGKYIASGSWDNTIRIWDATTGHAMGQPLNGHTSWVMAIGYSPDGKHIVSGSWDNTIRVWDVLTGHTVGEPLDEHKADVTAVTYSPDGKWIASSSGDGTIKVWDTTISQSISESLKGHMDIITAVVHSPDGKHIASGSSDNIIRIWDATTGHATGQLLNGHTKGVTTLAYSPDGQYISSGSEDNTVRIWDTSTSYAVGEPLDGHKAEVTGVAYSPDGKNIASSSWDTTIRVWDVYTGQTVNVLLNGHTSGVTAVAYSPDGKWIASGSWDNTIRTWDAATGHSLGEPMNGHVYAVISVAYSPDCKHIASGSVDSTIRIWDTSTGCPAGEPLKGHASDVTTLAYSPDGKHIASGSLDKTIRIWDTATGHPVGEPLNGHTAQVAVVTYSPDGKYIVSGSHDNTIRVWDASATHPLHDPIQESENSISVQSQSPTASRLKNTHTIFFPNTTPMRISSPLPFFPSSFKVEDGWAISHGKILFWLPMYLQHELYYPQTILIIGQNPKQIDYSHFVFDTFWTLCKTSSE